MAKEKSVGAFIDARLEGVKPVNMSTFALSGNRPDGLAGYNPSGTETYGYSGGSSYTGTAETPTWGGFKALEKNMELDGVANVDVKLDTKSSGLGMKGWLGIGGLAMNAVNAGLAYKNYSLAKDQFAFNKMNSNRNYEANKTKYNNSLARTGAVNSHYGVADVHQKV